MPDHEDELADLRADIEKLQVEIDAMVAELQEVLILQSRQRLIAGPDPLDEIQEQVEKAAFITVYQADRMYNELGLPESAIESYEQAIKLFPNTRAARTARNRLADIGRDKGELL